MKGMAKTIGGEMLKGAMSRGGGGGGGGGKKDKNHDKQAMTDKGAMREALKFAKHKGPPNCRHCTLSVNLKLR